MQIELKLFATLSKYLPAGSKDNAVRIEVPDGTTPMQIFEQYSVPPEEAFLVVINGVFVSPEDRHTRALVEGDALAAWPPVAGG